MNAKLIFGLAIVAGLIAVFMVQRHVDNLRGETITVFKATVDEGPGRALGQQIEAVPIPAGLFPNLFDEAPTGELMSFVQATPLRESVSAGDILLFRHFDSAVDRGVMAEIPPGMKALSIPASETSSVAFFIQPGDIVDVLGTFATAEQIPGTPTNNDLYEMSTRPLVQAVKVLAVGNQYRASDRQIAKPYSSVTLLVSMEEAAKLVFARDFFGVTMTMVMRSENDTEVSSEIPRVGVETLNFNSIGNSPAAAGGE